MKRTSELVCALMAFALWSVAAIAQDPSSTAPGAPASAGCATCGVVASIRYVEKKGEGSGVGAASVQRAVAQQRGDEKGQSRGIAKDSQQKYQQALHPTQGDAGGGVQ